MFDYTFTEYAFPSHGSMGEIAHRGMTLHAYFAAKALPIVYAEHSNDPDAPAGTAFYELIAKEACLLAAAVVRALGGE